MNSIIYPGLRLPAAQERDERQGRRVRQSLQVNFIFGGCCCLPYNYCSNWTWDVRNFDLFGSTHCREFLYMELCSPAYFVRTAQNN